MSSSTTPKKTETVSKTTDTKKTDPVKTDTVKTDTVKTDTVKTDTPASDKTSDNKPQSASQSSISHFSSVSTPEYRQGWDQIFGTSKNTMPLEDKTHKRLPEHLLLTHKDIDATLQNTLKTVFKALALKEGFDIEYFDQLDNVKYKITCELK
jgi:hypothetical protein